MDHQRTLRFVASAALLVTLMLPALARAGFLASEFDAILGNLVLNCGFETGDFTDWTMTPAAVGSNFGVESIPPTPELRTCSSWAGALILTQYHNRYRPLLAPSTP